MVSTSEISANIAASDAWATRSFFRLARDRDAISQLFALPPTATVDFAFFQSLMDNYAKTGTLSLSQLALGRRKIRDSYVEYLSRIANSR